MKREGPALLPAFFVSAPGALSSLKLSPGTLPGLFLPTRQSSRVFWESDPRRLSRLDACGQDHACARLLPCPSASARRRIVPVIRALQRAIDPLSGAQG